MAPTRSDVAVRGARGARRTHPADTATCRSLGASWRPLGSPPPPPLLPRLADVRRLPPPPPPLQALGYNVLMIPTAAGVFYPVTHMQVRAWAVVRGRACGRPGARRRSACMERREMCLPHRACLLCASSARDVIFGRQMRINDSSFAPMAPLRAAAALGGGRVHGAEQRQRRLLLVAAAALPEAARCVA